MTSKSRLHLCRYGWLGRTLRSTTVLGFLIPSLASADIIVSDNFDTYSSGEVLQDSASFAENGWAEAWQAPDPISALDATVTDSTGTTDMDFTPAGGTLIPGGANSIDITNAAGANGLPVNTRQLFTPQGGTFYVGFALRFQSGAVNTNDRFGLVLNASATSMADGVNIGYNGVASGGAHRFFLRKGTGGAPAGPLVGARNGIHYLVAKVEKTGAGNYDKVTLWRDPGVDDETSKPDGDVQLLTDLGIPLITHVGFFGQNLEVGDRTRVDSLALATTYAELMAPAGDGPPNPSPPDTIQVETLADGSGTIVPAQSIAAGNSIAVYAIERDSSGAFVENLAASTWTLIDITGDVVPGDLVVAGDSKSATFTASGIGSAKIQASSPGASTITSSGVITTALGTATQVLIETQFDGSGNVVQAQNLTEGETIIAFAISRDAGGSFVANVPATWTLENLVGDVMSGDLVSAGDNLSATFTAGSLPGSATIRATSTGFADAESGTISVLRPLFWTGNGTAWDTSASGNWFLNDFTTPAVFMNGDDVNFDFEGVAASPVILNGDLEPRSVVVTDEYTFAGTGKITGSATLTNATATLTVLTDNDFTGQTTLSSPIVLGNGGTTGSLGTGNVIFNGSSSLTYNRSNSLVMDQRIFASSGGNASEIIVNSGELTLGGTDTNTNMRATVKSGATLTLAKTGAVAVGGKPSIDIQAGGVVNLDGTGGDQITGNGDNFIQIDGTLDLQGNSEQTNIKGAGVIDSSVFPGGDCTLNIGTSNDGLQIQTFEGQIMDSGWPAGNLNLFKDGTREVELGGINSYHGNTTVNKGVVRLLSDTAIPHGTDFGNVTVTAGADLDINGFDITINSLNSGGDVQDGTFSSTMLTIGDGNASGFFGGRLMGSYGVTKIGSGTQTLAGANSHNGNTTVLGGILVTNGGSIPNDTALIINGGQFMVNDAGTEVVDSLFFGGVQQEAGLWGSSDSTAVAPFIDDVRFTGDGLVSVTNGPATNTPYDDFVSVITNPDDRGPEDDPDKDGIENGVEFVIGGNPASRNDSALLPTEVIETSDQGSGSTEYLKFSFRRTTGSASILPTTEYNTDLSGTWTTAVDGVGDVVIVETPNGYEADVDRVDVYIPTGLAADGKLFARLVANP